MHSLISLFCSFLAHHRSRPTQQAYRSDLEQCANHLNIAEATKGDIEKYVGFLKQRFCNETVCRKFAALRAFYSWACTSGLIEPNPILEIVPPKHIATVPTLLSVEQAKILVQSPLVFKRSIPHWIRLRDTAILHLMYWAGLRAEEAVNMQQENVRLTDNRCWLRIQDPHARRIELNPSARGSILRYIAVRPPCQATWLFVSESRTRLDAGLIRKRIARYAAYIGMRNIYPKIFRTSRGATLINEGWDSRKVKKLFGTAALLV